MPYNVNKSNGELLVIVEDGTVDINSASVALVGKNYPGYGEFINENFIHLLENFNSASSPDAPIEGQLWYDVVTKQIKVYNGSTWGGVGTAVQLDIASTTPHFPMFIASETSGELFKIAKNKAINIQPSTGNIGINLNQAALSLLEINAGLLTRAGLAGPAQTSQAIHIHGKDGSSAVITMDSYKQTDAFFGSDLIMRSCRGTSGSKQALQANDHIGTIWARGHDGIAYSAGNHAGIAMVCSQTWRPSEKGTRIEFHTTSNNTTNPVRRVIIDHNGDLSSTADIIAFNTSDITLKKDIQPMTHALAQLSQLDGITFSWSSESGKDTHLRSAGLIAQQVEKILPQAVKIKESGFLGVDYTQIIPLLVESIKELQHQVHALQAKLV